MLPLIAITAVGVLGSLVLLGGRKPAPKPVAAQPAEVTYFPPPEEPPSTGTNPLNLLSGLGGIGKNLAQGNVLAAGAGAIGVTKEIVDNVLGGGEGKANTAAIVGPFSIISAIADKGARAAAGAVGITNEKTQQKLGILAAAGTVGLAGMVGQLQLLDAGLGLVSKSAQEKVHSALRQLDPTSSKSAVGKVVRSIGGLFG